jgi:hypothetical protein
MPSNEFTTVGLARRSLGLAIGCLLIVGASLWSVVNAQGPERTVKIPGLDLELRSGWQARFHQSCRFAVPGSWRGSVDGSMATAPDGSNISIQMFRITSWSAHKAQIKAAFGRVNVMHEDSDRRLWLEIGESPRLQHYVNVVAGTTVCSALLEIRPTVTPSTADMTKRIVDSVGLVPEQWPPDTLK